MEKKPSDTWPKYLPYTQVAMGMIQPEWLFMSHFFEDREEEEEQKPQPPAVKPRHVRINIRPRRR
ncbi:hypothetical protein H1R82_04425 [Thermoactinomyces intermedius]|uniref:Uncharacterized protein n=1 Tax=Thermoactinomyces intermedius TaxID=2024 RepID=A0A8I1DBT4_THEIN|nr:hypothetical protein [Thermoactinomyces intermedius]MBA4548855.1 hypothetical protein [Thermoactinomyces intermedius]MBA4835880.1 hypothetical protein [Thermoactinomyces intermedius]MBH8594733.1 hypothetical protein [Thermoactinomyces intermedius]